MRWRLLDEEETEVEGVIGDVQGCGGVGDTTGGQGGVGPDLRIALEKVRMKRRMKPSERLQGQGEGVVGVVGQGVRADNPPRYTA